ncbi:hypothetical protein B0H13DRAFT_2546328 [Mycena leptocephala]|nr:hypothetical protein B0H13DRAFT_2546328 [Mycena leptocephala]
MPTPPSCLMSHLYYRNEPSLTRQETPRTAARPPLPWLSDSDMPEKQGIIGMAQPVETTLPPSNPMWLLRFGALRHGPVVRLASVRTQRSAVSAGAAADRGSHQRRRVQRKVFPSVAPVLNAHAQRLRAPTALLIHFLVLQSHSQLPARRTPLPPPASCTVYHTIRTYAHLLLELAQRPPGVGVGFGILADGSGGLVCIDEGG